ncbi:unnamed protein product [Vicia faba]|uniref:PPC domain-containing protein n=1 Tax=Vicia faba TaxID=3906 RepID=A0AAV0YN88_VICFA|nr:unnamed protein product [Vicia faba]
MSDNRSAPSSLSQNVAKKKRGRPQGSKNRPKPTSIIKEESNILEPILIEIPQGRDVVESLINLARSHQAGISVMSGSGFVYDVTIINPITRALNFPIGGPIYMKSLMGTYINPNIGQASPSILSTTTINPFFSITLSSGDKEHLFGGVVGGKLMTAGNVLITAAFVKKSKVHRPHINNGKFHRIKLPLIKIDNFE